MQVTKQFQVIAKSNNTNSFGLFQMIAVAKDGEAVKTHASYLNVKEEGEIINQTVIFNEEGEKINSYFVGHEMSTNLPKPPKEVLDEIFKS